MKTFRRFFRWIIVFAMFISIMAPVHAAQDYGMTWEISEDGVLTISCQGKISSAPWLEYAEEIRKVIVLEGTTSLGENVFSHCPSLEEVVLPDTLREIRDYAFYGLPKLKSVFIPASVEMIFDSSFLSCNNLERIDVSPENPYFSSDSSGVLFSKDKSFLLIAPYGISGTYSIPDTVKSVGGTYRFLYGGNIKSISYSPFGLCGKLTQIVIPEGVERIGAFAFHGCEGLTEVTIPDSVKILENHAFAGCKNLEQVNFGTGLKSIGDTCFIDCGKLRQIRIPGNVWEIGDEAFSRCELLETVVLEDGICKIGDCAFLSLPNLKHLQLPGTLETISNSFARNCENLKSVTIPRGVKQINAYAFYNCDNLTEVTFEGDAPTFEKNSFDVIGLSFRYPENMENWEDVVRAKPSIIPNATWIPYTLETLPELPVHTVDWGVEEIISEDVHMEWELLSNGLLTFTGNASFAYNEFSWTGPKESVKKIVINEGCRIVSGFSNMPLLEEVVIPEGVRFILEGAFNNCPQLKQIHIPASVVYIDWSAFNKCVSLERIDVASGNRSYVSDEFGVVYNKNMTMLLIAPQGLSGSYPIPEGVLSMGGTVDYSYIKDNEGFFNPTATFFGFRNCGKLTEIVLNDNIQQIVRLGFQNCGSLEQVQIGAGVSIIEEGTFSRCNSLKEILVPGNVKTIGNTAFQACESLEKIVLEDGIEMIAYDAFQECVSLKEIRLPATVTNLNMRFLDCHSLEAVTIPATVTEIDHSVFLYCDNLKEITFEGNKPIMNESGFPRKELIFRYPEGDVTWNDVVGTNAGLYASITWIPYDYHNWKEATCDTPKTCADCGQTVGEPIGHNWLEASCTAPRGCTVCGITEEEALGHKWQEANCTAPKLCTECRLKEGEALGHQFEEGVCVRCGRKDVPGMIGDVDGNGKLTYQDALKVLRASIQLETLTEEQMALADFDGNGIINYNDALRILRASIGIL